MPSLRLTTPPTGRARLRSATGSFPGARGGQVAIVFGLMTIPLLMATGAALDYGRRNAAKAQLDAALDSAVLGVIGQKSNSITDAMLENARQQFKTEAAKVPGVTVETFVPVRVPGVTQVGLTATYTATVNTTFGGLLNISKMKIGGEAGTIRNVFQYIDFYLLLDNSPSMGLAATTADIANMKAVTGGCAFACHKLKNGAEDENDNYHIAKKYNIKLRIQILRDAVSNLVSTAKSSMNLSQQFRMETWTFSDVQTRLTPLTINLDQAKSDASKIDLAYSYEGESDNQTAYERAIAKMNGTVPASGDGVTAASPIRFLFFVTDGVQDTPIDGSVSNPGDGRQINANRFISPINPAICQAMKDRNIRIGVIYTEYLPLYDNDFYNQNVKPFEDRIGSKLKSCATDGLYFPVSTNGDIDKAMQQLFSAALASVRLTN